MITPQQLRVIYPLAPALILQAIATALEKWWPTYQVNTRMRAAFFLAQFGEETGQLRWLHELWGPTPAQLLYERDFSHAWPPTPADERNRLAYTLGNDEKGDGALFRGRGLCQLTGRSNYVRLAAETGLDCVNHPELLEEPEVAVLAGCRYWLWRGLNQVADQCDFITCTQRINGGLNGLQDRVQLLGAAMRTLGIS